MDLVDKWTAEGKINDGNKDQQNIPTGHSLRITYILKQISYLQ